MNTHEPDPAFLEHLEWQLRAAHRRRDRFARPVPSGPRWLRATGLAAASFLIGAACVATREQVRDQAEARVHVERASAEVEIAELKLDAAREALELARVRHVQGLIESGAIERAELASSRARVEFERAQLLFDEVRASGQPPREDVSAPLIDGTDYVQARLELELRLAEERLVVSRLELARMRTLFEQAFVSADQLVSASRELADGEREIDLLRRKADLRRAALYEGLDAERAELLQRQAEILSRTQALEGRLADARAELERRRLLVEQGVESVDALLELETNVATLEIELATARVEVEALEGRLRESEEGGDR